MSKLDGYVVNDVFSHCTGHCSFVFSFINHCICVIKLQCHLHSVYVQFISNGIYILQNITDFHLGCAIMSFVSIDLFMIKMFRVWYIFKYHTMKKKTVS